MRERTITYTGTGTAAPDEHGAPQPGLVAVFEGTPRTPTGHPIARSQLVGRGESTDIVLRDPGVSRAHMIVEPAPGGFLVRDLGSHNGTFVDGTPLSKAQRAAPYGAVIRIGKTLLLCRDDVRAFDGNVDPSYPTLVGGPSLYRVRRAIDAAKGATVPVLVEGETGTGKEVVAHALHQASGLTGELVEVNCAALPAELVESELFGHARGAFSGSDRARAGLFRSAHQGTLLLDEVGELPLPMQAKLLRVLETGQVRAVGDDRATAVEVRVIAATNRSLDEMVEVGAFRRDLLHRIAAARIALPPLRERLEDLPILCRHFLMEDGLAALRPSHTPPDGDRQAHATLPPDELSASMAAAGMEALLLHRWPGNARELRNALRGAAAAARAGGRAAIALEDVAAVLARAMEPDEDEGRARIMEALAAAGGNVTQAARDLGVARSGLYETLRRLKLDPTSFRGKRG
jgi:transcriptional regulator with PAS, ATPase and Fis domain